MRENRQRDYDMSIFVPAMLLLGGGLVMVFSASQMQALADFGNMFHYIYRQVLWVVLGLGTMVLMMKLRLDNAKRLSVLVFIAAIIGLIAVLVIGKTVSGAKRWIDIGVGTLQPSEFAKPALIILLAWYFDVIEGFGRENAAFSVIIPAIMAALPAGFVFMEPDFSTAVLFMVIGLAMVFVNTRFKVHLVAASAPVLIGGIWWAVKDGYRLQRILGFLNPWASSQSSGYQIIQTLYALGSGGIKGLGLGLSRQKMYYLPAQHTDFIFAVIGEELGLIGTLGFAAMYLIIAIRGLRLANLAGDTFRANLAYGLSIWIGLQAFINMGVVANLLPVTGMTLPLVSAGGSSMLPTMAAIGLLLNISRSV